MALVIVKTSTMPGWLQAFVKVDPVSHLTAAARDLMNATITMVFAPLTLHLYGKQD
jgi:ABC-2 type transport system permease protein